MGRLLQKIPTAVAAACWAVAMSYLTDILGSAKRLDNAVSALPPLLSALVPFVVLGTVVVLSPVLLAAIYRNGRGWYRRRKYAKEWEFRALWREIQGLKNELLDYNAPGARLRFLGRPDYGEAEDFRLRLRMGGLFVRLAELGIPVPTEDYDYRGIIKYLTAIEHFAKDGQLQGARAINILGLQAMPSAYPEQ